MDSFNTLEEDCNHNQFFVGTHLDSPIISTWREIILTALHTGKLPQGVNLVYNQKGLASAEKTKHEVPNWSLYRALNPKSYPAVYRTDLSNVCAPKCIEGVTELTNIVWNCLDQGVKKMMASVGVPQINLDCSKLEPCHRRWLQWEILVQKYASNRCHQPTCMFLYRSESLVVRESSRLFWFKTTADHPLNYRVLTYDQVLMIKDVLYIRYQVALALQVIYPRDTTLPGLIDQHYEWQETCLACYGNAGFEILKSTEALSKTYLSLISGDIYGEDGAYSRMLDKVLDKELSISGGHSHNLALQYDKILRTTHDYQNVVELFGLQKVSGHPLIDPLLGGLSAAKEAREPDTTLYSDADRLRYNFCAIYLQGYIERTGSWPNLVFSDTTTDLYNLSSKRYRKITRFSYPLADWASCRFGPTLTFDFAPNYLELMDDKSLGFKKSEIMCSWDNALPATSQRRLLLEMLARESVSAFSICATIMKRQVPDDWKVIFITPKERELKRNARMFAMMPFEMRLFFVLTEMNIADQVFRDIPQQVMTRNQLEMEEIFFGITKSTEKDHTQLYQEIDFERWNLKWRGLDVNSVGEVLDDLFGLPGMYTYAHEFFSECQIIVRTSDVRPLIFSDSIPESALAWVDHIGGFEGICQKLWTLCTISMVDLAIRNLELSYRLLVQGDNVILSYSFPCLENESRKQGYMRMRRSINQLLPIECGKHHQITRPEECIESSSVITMSKRFYCHGVAYYTCLKFCKMVGTTATDFPSVRASLGAIAASAVALADSLHIPVLAYYLFLHNGARYLHEVYGMGLGIFGDEARHKVSKQQRAAFIMLCLILPSTCGGYPIADPMYFFYKGGPDPLSKGLAGLILLSVGETGSRLPNRLMRQIQDLYGFNSAPDIMSLINDPYSIPLNVPTLPSTSVNRMTLERMSSFVKNKDVLEIISTESMEEAEELVSTLKHLTPFNPIIAHDILECSSYGARATIEKMFVSTRSVQQVVRLGDSNLVSRIFRAEHAWMDYLALRLVKLPGSPARSESIFDLATRMRNCWTAAGVPSPVGVTSHHPIDFAWIYPSSVLPPSSLDVVCTLRTDYPPTLRGDMTPYFGSKTRETRSEHGYKIAGSESTAMDARKLNLIYSQVPEESSLRKLIAKIVYTRVPVDLGQLAHMLPHVVGGNLSHRYAARVGNLSAYNCGSSAFLTYCMCSSDRIEGVSGSTIDYAFMIQEFFLFGTGLLRLSHAGGIKPQIVSCIIDSSMLYQLPDMDLDLATEALPDMTIFPNNSLIHMDELQIVAVSKIRAPTQAVDQHIDPLSLISSWASRVLRTSSQSRAIADGLNTKLNIREHLDVLEVRCVGIQQLIVGCAIALSRDVVNAIHFAQPLKWTRWNRLAYIYKNSHAMSQAISKFIGHPQIPPCDYCLKNDLTVSPRYRNIDTLSLKIRAVISREVDLLLSHHHRRLSHGSVLIFADDDTTVYLESCLTSLACCLYTSTMEGELTSVEAVGLLRRHLVPQLRASVDAVVKLGRVQQFLTLLLADPLIQHLYSLSRRLERLRDTMMTPMYGGSIVDALRRLRTLPSTVQVRRIERIPLPTMMRLPQSVSFSRSPGVSMMGSRGIMSTKGNDPLRALRRLLRHSGKRHGGQTIAIYTWWQLGGLLRSECTAVIGVGYGACAAVALWAGSDNVVGLDLFTSLPNAPHRFRSYKPPYVVATQLADYYTHSPLNITTSGDWCDTNIRARFIKQHMPSLIVIDLETGTPQRVLSLIPTMQESPQSVPKCVIKTYLSISDAEWIIADLSESGMLTASYITDVMMGYVTLILHTVGYQESLVQAEVPAVIQKYGLWNPTETVTKTLLELFPNTSDYALTASSNFLYMFPADSSLDNCIEVVYSFLTELRHEKDNKLRYTEWTEYLGVLYALYQSRKPPAVQVREFIQFSQCHEVSTTILGETIILKYTNFIENVLTRYTSRLLPAVYEEDISAILGLPLTAIP